MLQRRNWKNMKSVVLMVVMIGLFIQEKTEAVAFDFLPSSSAPEKEFQSKMNAKDYREALHIWNSSLSTTKFGQSADGLAVFSYLVYQNGMPYTGLQILTQGIQPTRLNPKLLKVWSSEVKSSPLVQKGWIQPKGAWRGVFDMEPSRFSSFRNKAQIATAFRSADRLTKDQVNSKARIWWTVATLAPQVNDINSSLRALTLLKNSGQTVIGQDLVALTLGRVLYQKGDITGAQAAYSQVPKSSNFWIEALEERAWADLRKDEFDKALGQVTTLLSPAISPLVGPEPYFMANLMNLKICDYPRLFKTSELFKQRHRPRLAELQQLASGAELPANLANVLERFERQGVSTEAAGPLVSSVPRYAFRDHAFVAAMETRRALINESQKAQDLGLSERITAQSVGQADASKIQAIKRLRVLAQAELKEYRINLNKMHIIEAEVIERLHLDDNLKGERGKLAKADDKGDVLVFPYNTDEVWLDELDNYKARVKDCPVLKGASASTK